MRYALLFALTLMAPALYADGDLAFIPDDIDVTPDVPVKPKPHHKPAQAAEAAAKPIHHKPQVESADGSAAHAKAPPAPTTEPTPPPKPRPVSAHASAPQPAVKPRPVAWSTPFQCPNYTDRFESAGDMAQHSLGLRGIYSGPMVSQDQSASFRIAQEKNTGRLQVMLGTQGLTFHAPAKVCEKQPGVIEAIITTSDRGDCLPVDRCSAAASWGMIKDTYTVVLSRPSNSQASNSVIVSGQGLAQGIYIGQPAAAR